MAARFKDVVEFGFTQLTTSVIKPRIKPQIDIFLSTSHNLTDVSYLHSSSLDHTVPGLYSQAIFKNVLNFIPSNFVNFGRNTAIHWQKLDILCLTLFDLQQFKIVQPPNPFPYNDTF